jgi:hypothetical protein
MLALLQRRVHDDDVRVIQLIGCTAAAVCVLAIGAASGAQRPDSGVRGLVLYGPTCPVQRPGQRCVRPYEASITVTREPAGTVVAHLRSAADGRFTVRLRAGRYLLAPHSGKPYPRAQSRTVSVHPHRFATVTIRFDSGIR